MSSGSSSRICVGLLFPLIFSTTSLSTCARVRVRRAKCKGERQVKVEAQAGLSESCCIVATITTVAFRTSPLLPTRLPVDFTLWRTG